MPLTLAVTAGDPCGIGPEIILKALRARRLKRRVRWMIVGDAGVFKQACSRLGVSPPFGASCPLIDCGVLQSAPAGKSSRDAGLACLRYLDKALHLWKSGQVQGIVTAPVTKWAIQKSLPEFAGHTEYFAQATRSRRVVMLFASDKLRVVVLTRHIPLGEVPIAVSRPLLESAVRLTVSALKRDFGIRNPRVVVCGVNPHAAEGRTLSEESRVLLPAIRALRRAGMRCEGPVAADGFFAKPAACDVVVAAYHDQGLIPFKMAARDQGCQVTLGLPFVRTSPDHGSALDIAGKGKAEAGSMIYALNLAAKLVLRRHAHGE